jgi:hypothetical protein
MISRTDRLEASGASRDTTLTERAFAHTGVRWRALAAGRRGLRATGMPRLKLWRALQRCNREFGTASAQERSWIATSQPKSTGPAAGLSW